MGRLSQVNNGAVLEEEEDDLDYGDEILDGEEEGDEEEAEEDDKEKEYNQEDEDNMSLLEIMSATVSSNSVVRTVQKGSKKIFGSALTVTNWGLKIGWVVVSSALIIGVPMMLAVDNERMIVESQNRMARQGPGAPMGPP